MSEHQYETEYTPEPDSFETGSTHPPKSYVNLFAFLLAAVILLCGIFTGLSLLNIRLWQGSGSGSLQIHFSFTRPQTTEISGPGDSTDRDQMGISDGRLYLGIIGRDVTLLEQRFYQLPAGYWIGVVLPLSPASRAGLQVGDILLSVNGRSVTTEESIQNILLDLEDGDTVQLVYYRSGRRHSTLLALTAIPI